MNINRQALLVYLRDCRDLEVANYILNRKINENDLAYREESKAHPTTLSSKMQEEHNQYENMGKDMLWTFGFYFAIWFIVGLLTEFFSFGIYYMIGIVIGAIGLYNVYQDCVSKDHSEDIAKCRKNSAYIFKYEQEYNVRSTLLKTEQQKVYNLLQQTYSANIIPNQYRNIQSVYYIYDYMSSSNSTFEEALLHEHLENGFQRILSKLDQVTSQLQAMRFAQARLYQQNQQMLDSLRNIESNTYLATQYAAISAYNSSINNYFSSSTYF